MITDRLRRGRADPLEFLDFTFVDGADRGVPEARDQPLFDNLPDPEMRAWKLVLVPREILVAEIRKGRATGVDEGSAALELVFLLLPGGLGFPV